MTKPYHITATTKEGDRVAIVTDSRERALRYSAPLLANSRYTSVSVEHSGRTYIGPSIASIP